MGRPAIGPEQEPQTLQQRIAVPEVRAAKRLLLCWGPGQTTETAGNLPIEPISIMDFSVSSGFRSSSRKWIARCAAGVGPDKIDVAYTVGWVILTVYRSQEVDVCSGHCRFFQLSILDFWYVVIADLINPGVRDL